MRGSALYLLLTALAACGPARPEPSEPSPGDNQSKAARSGGAWTECYAHFSVGERATANLANLTRLCGPLGGMRAITPMETGEQKSSDPVARYTFYVPEAGNCYRVYAAADSSVKDLDLLLRTPDGDPVAGDITHDSWPVLPPAAPACFEQAGLYVLEVSVHSGQGQYAVQVWGTHAPQPPTP